MIGRYIKKSQDIWCLLKKTENRERAKGEKTEREGQCQREERKWEKKEKKGKKGKIKEKEKKN